jgi:hypothetical protein
MPGALVWFLLKCLRRAAGRPSKCRLGSCCRHFQLRNIGVSPLLQAVPRNGILYEVFIERVPKQGFEPRVCSSGRARKAGEGCGDAGAGCQGRNPISSLPVRVHRRSVGAPHGRRGHSKQGTTFHKSLSMVARRGDMNASGPVYCHGPHISIVTARNPPSLLRSFGRTSSKPSEALA